MCGFVAQKLSHVLAGRRTVRYVIIYFAEAASRRLESLDPCSKQAGMTISGLTPFSQDVA